MMARNNKNSNDSSNFRQDGDGNVDVDVDEDRSSSIVYKSSGGNLSTSRSSSSTKQSKTKTKSSKSNTSKTTTTATTTTTKKKSKSRTKSKSSKTRNLLLEYYKLISNPNNNKEQERNQIKIDAFLKSKSSDMYERKYIMFLKHWTHSGLVIMCNEDINPHDAILRYDLWIEQRRYDKYEHYHKDNNEDEDEDEDEAEAEADENENENESGSEEDDCIDVDKDDDSDKDDDDDDDENDSESEENDSDSDNDNDSDDSARSPSSSSRKRIRKPSRRSVMDSMDDNDDEDTDDDDDDIYDYPDDDDDVDDDKMVDDDDDNGEDSDDSDDDDDDDGDVDSDDDDSDDEDEDEEEDDGDDDDGDDDDGDYDYSDDEAVERSMNQKRKVTTTTTKPTKKKKPVSLKKRIKRSDTSKETTTTKAKAKATKKRLGSLKKKNCSDTSDDDDDDDDDNGFSSSSHKKKKNKSGCKKNHKIWNENLYQLSKYKRENNGSTSVPKHNPYKTLAMWVQVQKREYKLFQANAKIKKQANKKNCYITPERIDALNKLGFMWQTFPSWDERRQELAEYKIKYGHTNVRDVGTRSQLGRWVVTQRIQYRFYNTKNENSHMTPARIKSLNKLDFQWAPRGIKTCSWEDRYRQYKKYVKIYGSTNMCPSVTEPALVNWVNKQRFNYKTFLRTGKKNAMTVERIKLLEDIGFQWILRSYTPRENQKKSSLVRLPPTKKPKPKREMREV